MNSVLVLLVRVRIRAVSIVMDTHGLQGKALSQGVCVCVYVRVCCVREEKIIYLPKNVTFTLTNLTAVTHPHRHTINTPLSLLAKSETSFELCFDLKLPTGIPLHYCFFKNFSQEAQCTNQVKRTEACSVPFRTFMSLAVV